MESSSMVDTVDMGGGAAITCIALSRKCIEKLKYALNHFAGVGVVGRVVKVYPESPAFIPQYQKAPMSSFKEYTSMLSNVLKF